jgi:ribosomal protein S18 acetylase RimI-like enzyme
LLEKVLALSGERGYCKITLEVREDNHTARALYSDLGFKDTIPPMHFWTKMLE